MISASLRSPTPTGVRQPATSPDQTAPPKRHPMMQSPQSRLDPDGSSGHAEQLALRGRRERLSGSALLGRRGWSGARLGRRRGVASRDAALTPDLKAKRDAALAEPAPAKPEQMNQESPEGAASSVRYFLELYRYAFMTGNTTELAAMSDDRCKFCQSTIDDANDIHSKGGWADKWDQEIIEMTFYEKLKGYDYNRVKVIVNYGKMASYYGDGSNPTTSEAITGQEVNFGIRYNNGRWMIGAVEVVSK